MTYEHLSLTIEEGVAELTFRRPEKANAIHQKMWDEIHHALESIDETPEARAVVLNADGKHFCAGIDFTLIGEIVAKTASLPEGRKQEKLRKLIIGLQAGFTAAEACRKPVIAAIHGGCYGAGIDLTTACDIRLASADAKFSVKEVDLAIVPDVGTLQRLPAIVGQGIARELCLTGRKFDAEEAHRINLVNRVLPDRDALMNEARKLARLIASKSPLAVRGIKQVMNFSREHSIRDGLDYVATWNAGVLLSADGQEAFAAAMEKREAKFED